MRVHLDCDNTFDIPGRDIDDALALVYLLKHPSVTVTGITTSFGNGAQSEVWEATTRLVDRLGLDGVPVRRGADGPGDRSSPASELIESYTQSASVRLLVTGSATNVVSAVRSSHGGIAEVVMMGGITAPLVIGGEVMDELNISCDADAVRMLLESGIDCSFVTGNLCLDAFLGNEEVATLTRALDAGGFGWMCPRVESWCEFLAARYGAFGFHPWDLIAAVFVTDPSMFKVERRRVDPASPALDIGRLPVDETSSPASTPDDSHDMPGVELGLPVSFDIATLFEHVVSVLAG